MSETVEEKKLKNLTRGRLIFLFSDSDKYLAWLNEKLVFINRAFLRSD
jgi:hypothetical protein